MTPRYDNWGLHLSFLNIHQHTIPRLGSYIILHHREFLCLHKLGVPYCQETIQLVLATLVQCMVGKRYYIAALNGWFNDRFLGMDFLVVLGTMAAYYTFSIITFIKHLLENTDT